MKSRKAEGPRLRLSIEEVDMIRELRAQNLENVNDNSALTDHLNERGIDKNDVISVKHWQSASGEYRFSIVTKENLALDIVQLLTHNSFFIQTKHFLDLNNEKIEKLYFECSSFFKENIPNDKRIDI